MRSLWLDRGPLGTVYWEDEPEKERVVARVCRRCQERAWEGRIVEFSDVMIVGPRGVAHIQSDVDETKTVCGSDATGKDWWWRL